MKRFLVICLCIKSGIVPAQGQPVASFTASSYTLCAGGAITFSDLSTNNPTTWTWTASSATTSNGFSSTPTFTFYTPGNFMISLTTSNQFGNSNTVMQLIQVKANPTVTAVTNKTVIARGCEHATLTAHGAYTYTWSTTETSSVIVVFPLNYGMITYSVTGTGLYGCTNNSTVSILVWLCEEVIEQDPFSLKVQTFPNPNNGDFILAVTSVSACDFELYNMFGDVILCGELSDKKMIDFSDRPSGIYILKVRSGKVLRILRLIKE